MNVIRNIPASFDRASVSRYYFPDKVQLLYSLLGRTSILGGIIADVIRDFVGWVNSMKDEVQKYKKETVAALKDEVQKYKKETEEKKSKEAIVAQSKLKSLLSKAKEETTSEVLKNISSYPEGQWFSALEKEK